MQIMYNHEPCYDSGGIFWTYMRHRLILVLSIYQIIMATVLSLKEAPVAAALTLMV